MDTTSCSTDICMRTSTEPAETFYGGDIVLARIVVRRAPARGAGGDGRRARSSARALAFGPPCPRGRETKRHREEPWPPAARPKRRHDRTSSFKSPNDI